MSDTTTLATPAKPGLSDERKRELLDWWGRIRDGEVPAPLEIPQKVRDAVQAALARVSVRATRDTESRKFLERSGALDYLYGGNGGVIILDVPGGFVVLTKGEEEWDFFYESMPRAFIDRTHMEYPEPWQEDE